MSKSKRGSRQLFAFSRRPIQQQAEEIASRLTAEEDCLNAARGLPICTDVVVLDRVAGFNDYFRPATEAAELARNQAEGGIDSPFGSNFTTDPQRTRRPTEAEGGVWKGKGGCRPRAVGIG
jgi:hypothetical protein